MFCFGLRFVLQTVLIQVAKVDFIIPRGGTQGRILGTPPYHPGAPLRRDITANREGLIPLCFSYIRVLLND